MKAASLFLSFSFLVACGGSVVGVDDSGADSGTGNDGSASSKCPSSPPQSGTACVSLKGGPTCEYGSNPDPNCNQMFVCTQNVWVDHSSGTVCAPQSQCPATYTSVPTGQNCTPDQLSCAYPEGECICTTSFGGLQKQTPAWDCFAAVQGCPSPRPDIGSACSGSQTCNYGACSGGVQLQCIDGSWQTVATPCPQ